MSTVLGYLSLKFYRKVFFDEARPHTPLDRVPGPALCFGRDFRRHYIARFML
jgi:hypothetical protein